MVLSIFLVDCVGPAGKVVAIVNRSRLKLAEKQYSKPNLVFFKAKNVIISVTSIGFKVVSSEVAKAYLILQRFCCGSK